MSDNEKVARYKEGLLLTKDNKLIRMHANMTPLSYKLTNYFMLKAIKEGRLDNLQITVSEMRRLLNIKITGLTPILKAEAGRIAKTVVEVNDANDGKGQKWNFIPLLADMHYENGVATAEINPKLMPYISGLTGNFTRTDYRLINACNSYFAMRLAEVCNSWLNKGRAYYSVNEWRGLLGATGKSYDVMSQFRKRVLKPAVDEVNTHMDFTIKPIEHKEGRNTTHIEMIITRKTEPETALPAEVEAEPVGLLAPKPTQNYKPNKKIVAQARQDFAALGDVAQSVVQKMVEKFGLSMPIATDAVTRYGVGHCQKQMDCVNKALRAGKKITNKGGYLRRALEEGYAESQEAMARAKAAEEADHKDKALWNKQAHVFFHGQPESQTAPQEPLSPYEKAYGEWKRKKDGFRFQLMQMVRDDKLDFGHVNDAMIEFDQRYPPPKRADFAETQQLETQDIIAHLLDNMSVDNI